MICVKTPLFLLLLPNKLEIILLITLSLYFPLNLVSRTSLQLRMLPVRPLN